MVDAKLLIEKLLRYSKNFLYLNDRDTIYFRNLLLREFKESSPCDSKVDLTFIDSLDVPDILVEEIEQLAREKNLIEEGFENLYSTYIMGILSPLPSVVNSTFNKIKDTEGIDKACEYFYNLSVKNNYVQKTAIGKNLKWDYVDGDRTLEITINLSKPEKNNKDIAKLLTAKKDDKKYPDCFLCKENEGFAGTATHPARENIRTISLTMGGEPWFVQYSPYAYYNEHLIAISENHVNMHIESDTVDKVLDFVDYFPNYMIGSNAALPIIGGSILNHEHFQGGGHLMPMHYAPILKEYVSPYSNVKVGRVNWYNSVIRLSSFDRESIGNLTKDIIKSWANYTNESCNIFAITDGVRHNSLSPVCRKTSDGEYIMDIILRNNITTEEYPDGLFHAHPEYHNIKKEGIGLIEAMGLFILPGRLKKQLDMIGDILCKALPYNENELNSEDNYLYVHKDMIKELVSFGFVDSKDKAMEIVTNKVNETCKNILYNTAVFKNDKTGNEGFENFLKTVNIVNK